MSSFDDLLRRLGDQHELEVRMLREQVVQLQREARKSQSPMMLERTTKDETTASTFDPGFDDEKGFLPASPTPPLICHPVHISKPDSEIIINGNGETSEAQDQDVTSFNADIAAFHEETLLSATMHEPGLDAAYAVAMDESTDLDDVLEEIALKVAHDRIKGQPSAGKYSQFSGAPLPEPHDDCSQPQLNSNNDSWWWDEKARPSGDIDDLCDQVGGQQVSLHSKDEHRRSFSVVKESSSVERKTVRTTTNSAACRGSTARRSTATAVSKDGQFVLEKFGKLDAPVNPMGRWERLIDYATTVQFLQALPTVSPAWVDAAKEGPQKSILGLGLGMSNFKSLVLKNNSTGDVKEQVDNDKPPKVSGASLLIRTMQNMMMHPTCRRRVIWDIGGITLLLHDVIFIPIQQAFENGTEGLGTGYEDFLNVLDLFGASFWTLDICVSFLTGYYSNEGFVEVAPIKVARHYLRSWFPLDMMIVSVDWCTMFIGMSAASGYMRLGKTVSRIMRVLRLLRFLKMNSTMRELMERINSEYLLQLVNLMKTLILIVIINHYIACVWYGVGAANFTSSAWTHKFLVNYPNSFPYAYATALHWSLTQFTPASMEVVPQNAVERFFTIFVIILALVAFSSFVSSITAAMTHIRNINARQVQEEASIRQFFSEHKISHGTASRVWHFVRKHKGGNLKRLKESDVPALKNLPHKIKEDLRLEIYMPMLGEHSFFSELHSRDKAVLNKICNSAITEKTLHIGQEIFGECKQSIPAMFFVGMGSLVYIPLTDIEEEEEVDSSEEKTEMYINRFEWACESALWADSATISGSFQAVNGPAEVIFVDAIQTTTVLKASSSCIMFCAKYAELFMEAFRDMCCIAQYNDDAEINVLFNDSATVQKWVGAAKDQLGENQTRYSLPRAFPFLGASSNTTS